MRDCRKILSPYNWREACTVEQAADRCGKAPGTIRNWIEVYGIGRRIVGEYAVSRVALEMLLEGDDAALCFYHAGEHETETVARYFVNLGLTVPLAQIVQSQQITWFRSDQK